MVKLLKHVNKCLDSEVWPEVFKESVCTVTSF